MNVKIFFTSVVLTKKRIKKEKNHQASNNKKEIISIKEK
jgi:hypothetical protein